jgi:hypothetical protein
MLCLTTSRWHWIVSLLFGSLLEMCGYLVGVLLLLTLQTCTGITKKKFLLWVRYCPVFFLLTLLPARLCIVFLTFSCIGYAMPFILCAMICCCLPCIISVMGFREDTNNTRGATSQSINSLPTYKFKTKKRRHGSGNDAEGQDGGIVAAGTDKERSLSAEDAVCLLISF